MTSRSVYKFPRLAALAAQKRSELASEMLFHASASDRSIGAHVFVDSFLERFVETGNSGDVDALAAWLAHATARENPARPPAAVAQALVPVLQAAFVNDELLAEGLVPFSAIGGVVRDTLTTVEGQNLSVVGEVDAAIGKIMSHVDERDPLTAEHSRAVASWCSRIARRLGMGEEESADAGRAGMVHDIGKIRVPLHVLRAPRSLTHDEWDLMRSHVDFGDRIAMEDRVLERFRPAIRYHHERMDGSGYPYGLRGEQIPFVARIVTVADAFNAMIGRRPYRPPILPSMALFELQRSKGTQFDPDVVDALEAVITRTPD